MSDVMRPPAWVDMEEIAPTQRRAPVQREASFQVWTERFINVVVAPPMMSHANVIEHKDMRNVARVSKLKARGAKFGWPDHYVCQSLGTHTRSLHIELKRGSSVSENQNNIHRELRAAGQHVSVCRTIHEVLQALRDAGFALHGNADNLAAEYEARVDAAYPKKAARKPSKKKIFWKDGKTTKPGKRALSRVNALRTRVLF